MWCFYVCTFVDFHLRSGHANGYLQKKQSFLYIDKAKSFKNELQKADILWLYMAFRRDTECMKQGVSKTQRDTQRDRGSSVRVEQEQHFQAQNRQRQQLAAKTPVLYCCLLKGKTTQEFMAVQESGKKGKYFYKVLQKRLITLYIIVHNQSHNRI